MENMKQVPSYVMLGIPKPVEEPQAPPTPQHPLSPMGEACSRMDLTAIHQILFTTHYRDDEGSNEVKISAFWLQSFCSVGSVTSVYHSPCCSYRFKNGHNR